jgi:hypothetical protein
MNNGNPLTAKQTKELIMRPLFALLALTAFPASVIAQTPPNHPTTQGATGAPSASKNLPNKGKVVSAIDTGMYTYMELSSGKETVWIAVTAMPVKKGDTVAYDQGAIMTNFYSKTLNRTFPQVMFVGKVAVVK